MYECHEVIVHLQFPKHRLEVHVNVVNIMKITHKQNGMLGNEADDKVKIGPGENPEVKVVRAIDIVRMEAPGLMRIHVVEGGTIGTSRQQLAP